MSSEEAGAQGKFHKRDFLHKLEQEVQRRWAESREFEADAPEDLSKPKFMCTFPYPYMNGRLHLGHAFSLSKAEFAAGYNRLKGRNTLFPFAFHCTGMPIQAAANKLGREMDTFGVPPNFEVEESKDAAAAGSTGGKQQHAKVAAKTGGQTRQWEIMRMSGVAEDEIPAFRDAGHWLRYFPPLGKADLERFGAHVDWRRSFITTSENPFYDAFVRWHFNTLRKSGRIGFGKRPVVYSIVDGQACADHDRASGEGVNPQEYTLIKLRVAELRGPLAALEGRDVFLVAATLRPETMYGQTNCFVLPEGEYGAFEMKSGEVFVCSERSARNMSYQDMAAEWGKPRCLATLRGTDLLGLPLKAPMTPYEVVYCLPLLTISMGKGTGVVTSVPSDAPDDFAALRDLKEKPKLREKYGITDEMVLPFEVVEIIEIPGMGRRSAEFVCEELGVRSQNDKAKLAEAKERTYMRGFYEGVMLVGSQAGKKVCDAKPLVREEMMAAGTAAAYHEPESTVVGRSGDECVVAYLDQWFIRYGEEDWREAVRAHVEGPGFTTYNPKAMHQFQQTLGWLHEWACSRSFGLGTKLPWDEQFVIESLSDSTIYMAYYTVAHLLQGGSLDGSVPGPLGIAADQLTDEVFDYVFRGADYPAGCAVEEAKLAALRREFEYWYPMDLRVSGKDLIKNHLTMSLYNHACVWAGCPDSRWPRSFFTNGHVMYDAEKMSKSKGNFLTMLQAVERWSADAVRFALSDAGDGLDDANFAPDVANVAILKLYIEIEWAKAVHEQLRGGATAGAAAPLRATPPSEWTVFDRVFNAEMAEAAAAADAAYARMAFRDALAAGFHGVQRARDMYRDVCDKLGVPMHAELVRRFLRVQFVVLAPICPHVCEHVWQDVLGEAGSVTRAAWPELPDAEPVWARVGTYLRNAEKSFRALRNVRPKGKADAPEYTHAFILVAKAYPPWKERVLTMLAGLYDAAERAFPQDVLARIKTACTADPDLRRQMKLAMSFASHVVTKEVPVLGADALATSLPFDETDLLRQMSPYLAIALDLKAIDVFPADDPAAPKPLARKAEASPGAPLINFYTKEE